MANTKIVSRFYNNTLVKTRRRQLRHEQTDAEKLLWSQLRNKQLHGLKFFRQYSVGKYILDFYCPSSRLAVEIDGSQHMGRDQVRHDQQRSAYLKDLQIRIVRYWNNEVLQNLSGVCEKIAESLITPPNLPLS